MKKNKLIVFEGIDGVGKTTISKLVSEKLVEGGIPAIRYEDFEEKNKGFNIIKPFIKKMVPINSSLFFYVSSGIYKSEIIKNLLREKWVLCDRYIYSTIAYHKTKGANINLLPNLTELPIIMPNFFFLVKTKENIRIKRIKKRKNNIKQDLKSKKKGNPVQKMEMELEKFKPIIVDNSSPDIDKTIKKISNIILK